jgi:hypothetical protein
LGGGSAASSLVGSSSCLSPGQDVTAGRGLIRSTDLLATSRALQCPHRGSKRTGEGSEQRPATAAFAATGSQHGRRATSPSHQELIDVTGVSHQLTAAERLDGPAAAQPRHSIPNSAKSSPPATHPAGFARGAGHVRVIG